MRDRALVTGGTGFIGKRVVARLSRFGFEAHTCGRRGAPGVEAVHHIIDLTDSGAAEDLIGRVRPRRILHLAWDVKPDHYWTSPDNAVWRDATLALGRAAARMDVERFVGVGSCAEYDALHDLGRARREDDPLGADNAYGIAKARTFRGLTELFQESATRFAWARLFHLHGEGEAQGRLGRLLKEAVKGGGIVKLARPFARRDYSDVDDIGESLARLLAGDQVGPVNIASGRSRTIAEVALDLCGHPAFFDASSAAGASDVLFADVARARAWGLLSDGND